MNWQIFSVIGYLSVGAWVLMILCWGLHWLIRPRRWFCHLALILGVAALVMAKINYSSHVDRMVPDQTEQIERALADMEAKRARKDKERAQDVAGIRFAEDSRDDFLDKGGMDEGEKAYYESDDKEKDKLKDDIPAWKRKKQKRDHNVEDNSLEAAIGAKEETEGVEVEGQEEKEEVKPIVMSQADLDTALRLDDLNHKVIRILIGLGILLLIYDYLRRCNVYNESYLPLPLPNGLVNSMTPLKPVLQPKKVRRSLAKELPRLIRQGATFLYLSDSASSSAEKVPERASRWPLGIGAVEILPATFKGEDLSAEFVLDALWFGRCAFTVDSKDQVDRLLADMVPLLVERKGNRAHARANVHVVWDLHEPPSDVLVQNIEKLGPATGFSLFVPSNGASA